MTSRWNKFKLLMWKNWTLQKRNKTRTIFEILSPLIFISLSVLIRSLVEPEQSPALSFDRFKASHFVPPLSCPFNITVSYSPKSDAIRDVLRSSAKYLLNETIFDFIGNFSIINTMPGQGIDISCFENLINITDPENIFDALFFFNGYDNSTELSRVLSDPGQKDSSLFGIQFDDNLFTGLNNKENWPSHTTLTFRFPAELRNVSVIIPFYNWRTNLVFPVIMPPGPRGLNERYGGWPSYVGEGFIPWAHSILREITALKSDDASQPELFFHRFPHPSYLKDDLLPVLEGFISFMIVLSFYYTCMNTVRVITQEKEDQLKEVMKIMGLSNWLHWTAWFAKTFTYLLISVIFIILLLKIEWYTTEDGLSGYSIFTNIPWHLLLFFMIIYIISSICFWFMLSTFFSKASTAATIGGLIWFLTYLPFDFLNPDNVVISLAARLAGSLLCNTALGFGFLIISRYETNTQGLQWATLFTPITNDDPLVMGYIIIMLLVDAVLYMAIALYVEQVWPGSYGVAKPWYFLFTKDFWSSSKYVPENEQNIQNEIEKKNIEPDPKALNVGINIVNLTKVFNGKTAVDKLSLKIFENQITVLLGHNGAGKTTTMSMLTGMISPTSGTAFMDGYDIRKDIDSVRNSLGLCPQHNVLFSDLTVAEHIYFFSRLKGLEGIAIDEQIDKYIKILGLEDKRNINSSALSGGMKRRLSVCTALCGNSRIILLDEPTSGMDPSARRKLWDLLQLEKKGRTMILTTHFMDEADILGERVAILSNGNLRCVGSPFYLKKNLGMGYRLIAARELTAPGTATPSVQPVVDLLTKYVPEAKLYSDIGSEVSFVLPDESAHLFEPMLSELEDKQKDFGLTSFGISAATLEEVFMKVGTDSHKFDEDHNSTEFSDDDQSEGLDGSESNLNGNYTSSLQLFLNQWKAMLYKKWLVWMRSKALVITHVFIPVALISFGIIVTRLWENPAQLPSRELELANGYESSITFLSAEGALDDEKRKFMTSYEEYFKESNIDTMEVINIGNKSMSENYLENAELSMATMRMKNFAGATVGDNELTAWFSNFPIHDVPISFSLAHKAIMGALAPNSTFTLVNHPLPFTLESRIELLILGDGGGFQLPIQVATAMVFVSAFFIIFYIKENTSRSKLLQMASGMSPGIFWNAAFLADFLYMALIGLFVCFTFAAFQQNGLSTGSELSRLFLVILIFGWAVLPFVYLASFLFSTPSNGYTKISIFHFIVGVAVYMTVQILYAPAFGLTETADIIHQIFLIFPNYALPSAVKTLYMSSVTLKTCLSLCDILNLDDCNQYTICERSNVTMCCISDDPYFEWSDVGVLPHITYMLVVGCIVYTILLLKEYQVFNKLWKPRSPIPPYINPSEEDSDVAAERARISSLPMEQYTQYNLLCNELSKYYGKFLAVNQLTLGVKDAECFGLLGINGAGKTTTFKMLTGDLQVSQGNAWVKGFSVIDDMKTVYQNIGYCPQFDALLEELTGRETLRMFSLIRGIPKWRQESFILKLSKKLGFAKHLDKQIYQYSGGNKRKLSTSLALLGDPQVVYLDEPTTGMDPSAKRLFWKAITECQCVILTSHSMEECEALCTRLAIMVDGQPKCIGSPQHLKNKFSQGYTLIIKLKKSESSDPPVASMAYNDKSETLADLNLMYDFDSLNKFLISKFPSAEVKEMYQGLITYNLPDKSIKWSTIFGVMESVKKELNIEDYSIGQTTLEQIFLEFTRHQISCSND